MNVICFFFIDILMNCVLFAKMDQVFRLKNQNIKENTGKIEKHTGSSGEIREFCQSGKVGTMYYRGMIPNSGSLVP